MRILNRTNRISVRTLFVDVGLCNGILLHFGIFAVCNRRTSNVNIMKRILFLVFLITAASGLSAQKIQCDPVMEIVYDYFYKRDPAVEGYHRDRFSLVVGAGNSLFRSVYEMQRDSVSMSLRGKGIDPTSRAFSDALAGFPSGSGMMVYKDRIGRSIRYMNEFSGVDYVVDDEIKAPVWQLSDDTLSVEGYLCRKAVTGYLGRTWTAWYCPEIPVPDGPWLLWGLPGAVLLAEDQDKYFIFRAIGFNNIGPDDNRQVEMDISEYKKAAFSKVLRFEQLEVENFRMMMELMFGVTFQSESNQERRPYIPMAILK